MAVDDGLYNPQSEPQTAGLGLFLGSTLEAREYCICFGCRGPWALIFHPTLYVSIGRCRANADHAVFRRKFVRIRQKVDEHLRQSRFVARDEGEVLGQPYFERLP